MDNSFNTLIRSLRDNYIQYKVTGSDAHKRSYESAQQGIEKILSNLEASVKSGESQISDFYSQHNSEDIRDQTQTLHSTLLKEDDELTAAKLRQVSPEQPAMLPQYIAVAVLAGLTVILSFL